MVKKIECTIISSVSLSSNKKSTAANKEISHSGQGIGVFASYKALLRNLGGGQEIFREGLNILA